VWDALEILFLFAHLVRISKSHTEESLTARFERDHVLARGEDNLSERHHALLTDRFANDGESLLTDFAIGSEVIWAVQIKLIDFLLRHEFVDFDCALALNRHRFKLFGLNLDILPFADLVALDDFC